MMILLLGAHGDEHANLVQMELERRGAPVARLDPDEISGLGAVSLALASAGRLDGVIRPGGGEVHIEEIQAVWISGHHWFSMNPMLDDIWDVLDVPVIPAMPSVVERARHDARQLRFASELGFAIPDTVMTQNHSRVSTQQSTAPAKAEVRVTVVGDKVFAAAITSPAAHEHITDWWRYEDSPRAVAAYALPAPEVDRCRRLVQALGLEYATIDFAITPDNLLTFLRLDPHGHYRWIEESSGLPITRALVNLLIESATAADRPLPSRTSRTSRTTAPPTTAATPRWSRRQLIEGSRRLHPSFAGSLNVTPV